MGKCFICGKETDNWVSPITRPGDGAWACEGECAEEHNGVKLDFYQQFMSDNPIIRKVMEFRKNHLYLCGLRRNDMKVKDIEYCCMTRITYDDRIINLYCESCDNYSTDLFYESYEAGQRNIYIKCNVCATTKGKIRG